MAQAAIFVPFTETAYLTTNARQMANTTPALGPEWIRHVVRMRRPQHDLRIVYGEPDVQPTLDDIVQPCDAFVGFSCTTLSYRPILPLLEEARRRGLPTVVGGAHARSATAAILRNRAGILVAPGAGEEVIVQLLDGEAPANIAGLWSAERRGTRSRGAPYEARPFLHETTDYSRFHDVWRERGVEIYRAAKTARVVAVRGINGCPKRPTCSFCSVPRVEHFDPQERARYLIAERRDIVQNFGEDIFIRDASDALPPRACLETMGGELGAAMDNRVYTAGMVWDLLDDEVRALARRAGYTDFLIGLECFSKRHFAQAAKRADSLDLAFDLLKKIRAEDINLFLSGIFGWAGESEATLAEAREVLCRLLDSPRVARISVNLMQVLPSTSLHREMVELGVASRDDDAPDLGEMFVRQLAIRSPCMSPERIQAFVDEMASIDDRVVQFTAFSPHRV